MAKEPVSKPAYANVPDVPGIPAMRRNPVAPSDADLIFISALGYANNLAFDALNYLIVKKWHIIDENGLEMLPDTGIVEVQYLKQASISKAPLEKGSFISYNKVESSRSIQLNIACTGTDRQRTEFIKALEDLVVSTQLMTIILPEYTHTNMNMISVSFTRSAVNGAKLIVASVVFEEVRQYAVTNFDSTKSGINGKTKDTGSLQPKKPDWSDDLQLGISGKGIVETFEGIL